MTLSIIGYTTHYHENWLCRGNEIEKWLQDNVGGMGTKFSYDDNEIPYYRKHYILEEVDYEYCIFDDDGDFLLG